MHIDYAASGEITQKLADDMVRFGVSQWVDAQESLGNNVIYPSMPGSGHLETVLNEYARQTITQAGVNANLVRGILTPQLFLGCGSTGTAALQGVIRNYPGLPSIYDPGRYDIHNAPRQMDSLADVGALKAERSALRLADLLPTLPIVYDTNGVDENFGNHLNAIAEFCALINNQLNQEGIDPIRPVIYDSIDVTTQPGWSAKMKAHIEAHKHRIPVIGAFDVGKKSQGFYFPYQEDGEPLLHSKIKPDDLKTRTPQDLNMALMPKLFGGLVPDVPLPYARQYIERARRIVEAPEGTEIPGMPQEQIAGSLFSAAAAEITGELLRENTPDVPRLFSVEVFPSRWSDKFRLALLFATNLGIINAAGQRDK